MPTCWAAKQMTVVVPPNAADVGGALEGVGVDDAGGGQLLDVGVAVDAAGQHQAVAWRRSRPVPGARLRPMAAIVPSRDADVGVEVVDRRGDAAAADHAIE